MRQPVAIAMLLLMTLVLLGAGPPNRKARLEDRAWQGVEAASNSGAAQRALDRAEEYLAEHPDGPHFLEVKKIAGESAMELELWTACRRHLDGYLSAGGRVGLEDVAFRVATCLAREGRTEDALPALRNVAVHDADEQRAASAGRELVALHLFAGEWPKALEAQGLLLDRGLYERDRDFEDSQRAAQELGAGTLEVLEGDAGPNVAGLVAILRMDAAGELIESDETEDARRRFADLYHAHPLIDLVPGAAAWAAEPEDTDAMVIGVLLPLSGKYRAPGEITMRGIELAIERARAEDGLNLPDLRLVPIDTTGDPEVTVEALRRLADVEKAIGVIGPIISTEAEAVAAAADDIGLPVLMMTHNHGLAGTSRNAFNTLISTDEQVDAVVDHAVGRLGLSSFAIAYPNRETGGRMAARFWDQTEAAGGSIAAVESFPAGSTDFRETARRILGREYLKKPPAEADMQLAWLGDRDRPQLSEPQVELEPGIDFQAVFVPDNYKTGAMLAPGFLYEQINMGGALSDKRGLPVQLIGAAAFNHPDLIDRGGKYTEGTLLVDGFFADSLEPAVQEFVLLYKGRHGAKPSALEAVAYDTTWFVAELIAGGATTRRELRSRLSLSAPQRSVVGARGFGPDGEMRHEMLVLQVKKGRFVQLHPEPPAEPIYIEMLEDGTLVRFKKGVDGRIPVDINGDPIEE
ncbi:MAG: ABC transporter substrate-binding protein [Proteobacteria bacterium]|nr:ABC transporter substrate-binding protein [Pseudomonadota bacterium]